MITENDRTRALDTETVNYYVAQGRRERSRAFSALVAAIFTAPSRIKTPSLPTAADRSADV